MALTETAPQPARLSTARRSHARARSGSIHKTFSIAAMPIHSSSRSVMRSPPARREQMSVICGSCCTPSSAQVFMAKPLDSALLAEYKHCRKSGGHVAVQLQHSRETASDPAGNFSFKDLTEALNARTSIPSLPELNELMERTKISSDELLPYLGFKNGN